MTGWLLFAAAAILLTLGGAFWRVWQGPGEADRMMAAQLVGTGGVGVAMLLAPVISWHALDVAIVLALLAAFAAVGFVKASSPDGAGDPEEAEPSEGEEGQ
ncbi:multiple resistance and pH regulation protein F [Rubellimicrobium sp. CFH 75288]|uniref:multiple resistance and pH regulation protein F n=1 Tax=Rubellimicrobium sp. CFH 75288 TaxID=2697034 RepID=UPI0014128F87|nr:multiple resistance and pH regulation protein F [Rubellimicrobium sp. CFH 75288]NAZ36784.1 multiple resistance and pH regulation protein F [Rubellimicrobium sp. CFH 75288]